MSDTVPLFCYSGKFATDIRPGKENIVDYECNEKVEMYIHVSKEYKQWKERLL